MLGLAVATLFASIPSGAVPEPATSELELEWSAPPQCPDAAAVRTRLRAYLGADAEPSEHRARGEIVADAGGWLLRLEIDGEARELRSQRCETLAEAAAVVLSLAMDPDRAPPPEPEPPVPAPIPPPVVAPLSADPRPASPALERRPKLRFAIRADSGVTYGIAPVASDAALTFALLWPQARLELRGLFVTPGGTPTSAAGERLRIFQGLAGPRGCWVVPLGRFELPICGGMHVGTLRVEARPARATAARHAAWAGIDAGAAFVWPFHRNVALWGGIDAIVALGRPRTTLPSGTPYRGGPAALRAAIGIEARFP